MAVATSVFHRVRTGSKIGAQYDQDGNLIQQVETREDEEQSVKLTEILELLLAAGYFRARIKGLSPFDKSSLLEEMGDYVRAYSISQFQKSHSLPEEVYKPQRKYRRHRNAEELLDEESRVHSTLLEYGRYGFSKQSKQDKVDEGKASLAGGSQAASHGVVDVSEEEDLQAVEEMRIKTLMTNMAAMATEEGKLTASAVGQLVGLQSEEIKQFASEYAEKLELSSEEHEHYGPLQQHHRAVASLNKQIQQKTKELGELQAKHAEVKMGCDEDKRKLTELLDKLRALVTMNENLKQQEQEFRTHCREEMTRLQRNIQELKSASGQDTEEEKERDQLIDKQYNTGREKLQKIRLLMQARRNREIAIMQRKIDEVPSRAELTQYQKRFIELYSQSATHKETKQFFTLYNTLDDKKVYLEKEVNLLNSIHDNFQAMSSSAAKEQFLKQMEQIVEGIKQNRIKMEKKKQENKMRRDQLNDEYLELLDKQRLYFKTVKDFKEECRKNEMLLSKLRAKGAS
uniref:Coiled-coil domain-containing protein 93 n=1 Tax=Neolamprologus brichardi TaxID=32507 RepID=A0A3Q4MYC1_NEOBR